MAAGSICTFDITLSVDPDASDSALLRAQSDSIAWTMSFTLQDAS